jgi:hypothetical protein
MCRPEGNKHLPATTHRKFMDIKSKVRKTLNPKLKGGLCPRTIAVGLHASALHAFGRWR